MFMGLLVDVNDDLTLWETSISFCNGLDPHISRQNNFRISFVYLMALFIFLFVFGGLLRYVMRNTSGDLLILDH